MELLETSPLKFPSFVEELYSLKTEDDDSSFVPSRFSPDAEVESEQLASKARDAAVKVLRRKKIFLSMLINIYSHSFFYKRRFLEMSRKLLKN